MNPQMHGMPVQGYYLLTYSVTSPSMIAHVVIVCLCKTASISCINTVFSPLCDKLNLFFSLSHYRDVVNSSGTAVHIFFRSEFMRLLCQTLRHTHATTKNDYTS